MRSSWWHRTSALYPSAIYFAASVWAFALVEEDRDVAAGLVLIAAVMARPNGFFVAIAIAFAVRWAWRRVLVVRRRRFLRL